eukprot:NODE_3342_length_798_cov_1109.612382.p9 GENE.NODE_3342_length_798_cov_1109.612382~~NODE_3342_length_798_cov_1109.612382.p9  ORF type:complete len:54 (+),score=5.71 NODE_3342_length_798_cov_1109.612382:227-388(+)
MYAAQCFACRAVPQTPHEASQAHTMQSRVGYGIMQCRERHAKLRRLCNAVDAA